jgi:hypothetical protein
LRGSDGRTRTIYSLGRKRWGFEGDLFDGASISAMETMDNGDILVHERNYAGPFKPFIVTIRRVFLKQCKRGVCENEILLRMNSDQGWSVQNFEGLAKVSGNRYLMISDNGKGRFQKTVLIYFEIHDI